MLLFFASKSNIFFEKPTKKGIDKTRTFLVFKRFFSDLALLGVYLIVPIKVCSVICFQGLIRFRYPSFF